MLWVWVAAAFAQEWTPCDLGDAPGAECATVGLPRDPAVPGGPTYAVAIKRFPAPSQPARGQIWFVTGGPGDAGTDDIASLDGFDSIAPDLDRYTFDARGTGGSGRLSCPDEEDPESFDGFEIAGDEWDGCVDHVAATYSEVLPAITTTITAHDLVALTDLVADEDDVVAWWGVSYGTFLVERALYIAPDRPDAVLLDGLVPPDWGFHEFDGGLDQVARAFLEECAADPLCSDKTGSDPVGLAEATLATLEDQPCAGIDAQTARLLTGVFLMTGERFAAMVPAVWVRLDRCQPRDRRAFRHVFAVLFPEDGSGIAERPGHSPVLQRHIAYADLWDPTADAVALEQALDDAISTTAVSANFADVAPEWPVVPPHDAFAGSFPVTGVPILAMHGGFDPTMPVDRLDGFEAWLDGPGQTRVIVPRAHHVTLNMGECPTSIQAAFLADPSTAPDTSCIDDMPAFDWDGREGLNRDVWGVPNLFGEEGCHTAPGTPFAALIALAALRRARPNGSHLID